MVVRYELFGNTTAELSASNATPYAVGATAANPLGLLVCRRWWRLYPFAVRSYDLPLKLLLLMLLMKPESSSVTGNYY